MADRKVEVQRGYITTQRTSKKWKFLRLVATVLIIGSIAGFFMGKDTTDPDQTMGLSILALLAGLIIYIISRVGAWWFNGQNRLLLCVQQIL